MPDKSLINYGMRKVDNTVTGHARQAVAKQARPDNASLYCYLFFSVESSTLQYNILNLYLLLILNFTQRSLN